MGESFDDLYERFCDVLNGTYQDDVERREAVVEEMASVMKVMLEKLRSYKFIPR